LKSGKGDDRKGKTRKKSGWKAVGSFPVLILKKWVEVAGVFD